MTLIQSLMRRFAKPATYSVQITPSQETEYNALNRLSSGQVTPLDPIKHMEANPHVHWPGFKDGVVTSFGTQGKHLYFVGLVLDGTPNYFTINFDDKQQTTTKQKEEVAKAMQSEVSRIILEPSQTRTQTAAKLAYFLATVSPSVEVAEPYRRYISNVHRAEYLISSEVVNSRVLEGSGGESWYILFDSKEGKSLANINVDSRFLDKEDPKTFLEGHAASILTAIGKNEPLSNTRIVAVADALDNLALSCCKSADRQAGSEIIVKVERPDLYELLFNRENRAKSSVRVNCDLLPV